MTGRFVSALSSVVMLAVLFALPAAAQNAAPTAASATVQGTVRSAAGDPLPGATVTLTGPTTVSATTDGAGAFSVSVPPGVYRVDARSTGYLPAQLSDLAIVAGTNQPLTIALTRVSLTSLQTIGSTTAIVRGSGSAINTGAATSSYVPAIAFENLANPQINDVLQHLPDVNIERMGSQPDTTIMLDGSQPYETQVLIDGHPIALGQYGVWSSQFFPSWLIGGAETQAGPGNTTPFANIAIAGTVNLLTPGFTRLPTYEAVVGVDSYNAQYSHLLATGSAGKLQYVARRRLRQRERAVLSGEPLRGHPGQFRERQHEGVERDHPVLRRHERLAVPEGRDREAALQLHALDLARDRLRRRVGRLLAARRVVRHVPRHTTIDQCLGATFSSIACTNPSELRVCA